MPRGNWLAEGKCDACHNVNAKSLKKIYPSGLIAKYFRLKDKAWICSTCVNEAEVNDFTPKPNVNH